jgi:hypothetical protein
VVPPGSRPHCCRILPDPAGRSTNRLTCIPSQVQ